MSIKRTTILSLLASLILATGQTGAADFNERYAAWQGRAPQPQRLSGRVQPAAAIQEESLPPPAAPSAGRANAGAQRMHTDNYSSPVHSPSYNQPWTNCNCATCAQNSGSAPGSDLLGDYGCAGGSCGAGGCGDCPCGACGGAGGGCNWGENCCNTLVWAKFDVLMWWRQGRDFPPLVTTDPTTESSTTAGILPDAEILFGNARVGTHMQAGGRIDFGFFTDPRQCVGYGFRVFGIGKDASNYNVVSNNEPVLAIPFRDLSTGGNDALLVAFPGLRTGAVSISGTSSVFSNDVYSRILLCRDCNTRLDFLTGWNYSRIADEVQLNSRSTVTEIGGSIPVGTISNTVDQFRATNDFNGGILGLQWQCDCGVWSTNVLTRMSLGNMHETIDINGSGRIAVPNQTPTTTTGGVFTAESNIGRRSRNEFTAITEIGVNFAYRFAPCTQLTFGYSFLYWNDILSAASAIDTTTGTAGGTTRPQFTFRHSDYWVQGLNLGLTRQF
jgi:Putative beta barrel porin-7 (BBP7)